MMVFDPSQEPPTRQELQAEQEQLSGLKRAQLKAAIISDSVHAVILLGLYFSGLLPGGGLLLSAGLGTVVAMVLISLRRERLTASDLWAIGIIVLGSAVTVSVVVIHVLEGGLIGGMIAGLATGSIECAGLLIGRRIKQVYYGLEALQTIDAEQQAHRELLELCRRFPELEDYRQQAREILRPQLTFGELQAMKDWAASSDRQG